MKMRLIILSVLIATSLCAFAAGYPAVEQRAPFAGRWKLDQGASRSEELNRIMELYGLNWFERWAANHAPIEQEVTWKGSNRVEVILDSPVSHAVTTFVFDREWRQEADPFGKEVMRSSWWDDENNAIMTRFRFPLDAEEQDRMIISRRVSENGDTLFMESIYQPYDSTNTISATRIFRVAR